MTCREEILGPCGGEVFGRMTRAVPGALIFCSGNHQFDDVD